MSWALSYRRCRHCSRRVKLKKLASRALGERERCASAYKADGKRDSYYLPTAFCRDVLLECHHIGKRLDWNQIHSWKKSGQRVPKGCLKQGKRKCRTQLVSRSPNPFTVREGPPVTHLQ